MLQVSYKYFQADFRGPQHMLRVVFSCQIDPPSTCLYQLPGFVCALGPSGFRTAPWPWPFPLVLETIPTWIMDRPVFAWTQRFCYWLLLSVMKSDMGNVFHREAGDTTVSAVLVVFILLFFFFFFYRSSTSVNNNLFPKRSASRHTQWIARIQKCGCCCKHKYALTHGDL